MAIRTLLTVLSQNYDVDKAASFHAGECLARDTTGLVREADRASDTAAMFVGFAADDKARTLNTMILIDPVGSTVIDGSGNLVASNNGYYVAQKRALADFQDESVSNISDLTSGASGYQGPRRGVGVYGTPSAQFITDQFAAVATTSSTADAVGAITFAVNDYCTFGAGVNKGKLVQLAASAHGRAVARVDKYDAAAGLLYVTQL